MDIAAPYQKINEIAKSCHDRISGKIFVIQFNKKIAMKTFTYTLFSALITLTLVANPIIASADVSITAPSEKKVVEHFQMYPNPVIEQVIISFQLRNRESVKVEIFDVTGKKVMETKSIFYPVGNGHIKLNASELNDGIYLCKVTVGNNGAITRRMIVRKQ